MEIRIYSVGFSADLKLESYIREKLEKVKKYNDTLIGVDVYLKLENSGQVKDKVVELKARVPGPYQFVKNEDKTFESSFDKALETFKRQLKKHNDKLKSVK
ncbi:MAG TPA: ribosome-associated translation inhibitor RaiA [Saprospiraceae bacterium]|nr:ribosome-associated translation inhibitor RaiA [Saprospiraceae bacterium]